MRQAEGLLTVLSEPVGDGGLHGQPGRCEGGASVVAHRPVRLLRKSTVGAGNLWAREEKNKINHREILLFAFRIPDGLLFCSISLPPPTPLRFWLNNVIYIMSSSLD